VDLSALEDLFTTVGDVERSGFESIRGSIKSSKVGILVMATEQQAVDCAARFHGLLINGCPLSVSLMGNLSGSGALPKLK